jgi:hypothetical protein
MIIGIEGVAPLPDQHKPAVKAPGTGFTVAARRDGSALAAPELDRARDLAPVLALQELAEREASDRRTKTQVETVIKALAALQYRILTGDPGAAAAELGAALAGLPQPADSRLAALLQAVQIRAKVEIARWELLVEGRK